MSEVRLPKAIGLTLCQSVEVVPETTGMSLIGLFQVLRFPAFPTPPMRFTVYSALYDGEGEGTIKLSFMHLETEQESSFLITPISLQEDIQIKIQNDFSTNHVGPLIRISSLSLYLFLRNNEIR